MAGGRNWDRTSDPSLVRRNQDENHTRSQNSYICLNCENSARRSLRMSARVCMVVPESGSRSTSQDRNTGTTSPYPPHDTPQKACDAHSPIAPSSAAKLWLRRAKAPIVPHLQALPTRIAVAGWSSTAVLCPPGRAALSRASPARRGYLCRCSTIEGPMIPASGLRHSSGGSVIERKR